MPEKDRNVLIWAYGILYAEPYNAEDFLTAMAQAIISTDKENYAIILPSILLLMKRYPEYKCNLDLWKIPGVTT